MEVIELPRNIEMEDLSNVWSKHFRGCCMSTLPTVNPEHKQCRHACKLQQPILAISDILYSTYNGCQT